MDIESNFTSQDFEVWVDHFQYLNLGERHQEVPSGKSFVRGTFDTDQDAYVITKIHIDPDLRNTSLKNKLLYEANLRANKIGKKLIMKDRVTAAPNVNFKPRIERGKSPQFRPEVTRDIQTSIWRMADSLARSLKDPQGPTPGDSRWTVSGLSHSSWNINHPDIMEEGESPLTLRIKKIPDGRWIAFGQNRLTNLLNTKILEIKKTPPGGDDWDDIENFAKTAATYFIEQKNSIMNLKQSMTPESPPGAGYNPAGQQGRGAPGGEAGGVMGSRRVHRREAAEFSMTVPQAMQVLGINGSGDYNKDREVLKNVLKRSHPDVNSTDMAAFRMRAANVLWETYIRKNKALPVIPAANSNVQVGGQAVNQGVYKIVNQYMSTAINGAQRLLPTFTSQNAQVSPQAANQQVMNLSKYVYAASEAIRINLLSKGQPDNQATGIYRGLVNAYNYLRSTSDILKRTGNQVNQETFNTVSKNLQVFVRIAQEALRGQSKQASHRAPAVLSNLRKAQRLSTKINSLYQGEAWFLGARVINDRDGIGVGLGARCEPPRRLRGSVEGIPVVLEGPGRRAVQARQQRARQRVLAERLAEVGGEESAVDEEVERELKRHQKLVRRVYNHINSHKRLYGSIRYLARKLKIQPEDLVRVIGQLIVEGKLGFTKKKKFQPLPPPHKPVPGIESKTSSTNSIFGIDRGRSDKRVDQLLSQSVYQLNLNDSEQNNDGVIKPKTGQDIREIPSKIMPDPHQPN